MKKKWILILTASLLLIFFLYFVYVWINIAPIEAAMKYAYLSDGTNPNKVSRYITQDVFYDINLDRYYKIPSWPETAQKNLKLKTKFALLGINNGYIWMKYSFEALDKSREIIYGSWKVPIKLDIKKKNGTWQIIKKYEAP